MSTRTFILAVTGFAFAVAACSSYGTSVVEVGKTRMPVASVSVSVPLSLVAGQTARATATPKDANGAVLTDRPVLWYTSSGSIASVSDSGIISAVAPGSAVVSAVSEGVAGQATMAVMPPPPTPIATVTVAVTPSAVLVGQTALATATLEDSSGSLLSGRTITWTSSNTNVATVDTTGKVKATGAGNASIKATSSGKSNSSVLTVSAPAPIAVASVSVAPANASLQVGASVQLSAVTRDSANNVLTGRVIGWSSANTGIATVSGSGLVTAVAGGSVSITASSEGQTGSAAITVSAPAPVAVASVSVSPATASLQVGGTVQLSATTRDANNNVLTGRVVTWSSSNTGISTVSASGLVTAVAAGSTTITATSETKTGTSAITVSAPAPVPVASVSVSPTTASLFVGDTVQFSAVTRDANGNILTGRVISWSSSNIAVATVSASGLARTLAAGTAQITATSELKIGSATLTASSPPPPGSDTLWRRNEPAGMTSINERPFSALAEPGWGVPSSPGATIVADATAPHSPSGTMHFNYPAGFVGGSGPESTSYTVANYRVLYLAYYFKYSDNWQGHLTGINKHGYVWDGNTPYFVYEVEGVGSGPLTTRMAIQTPVSQPNSDGWYYQNLVPSKTWTRGQWGLMEILLTGNHSGTADGALDFYMDGVHVAHYTGIQFTTGQTAWNWVRIAPIWGGITDTVVADMWLSFDHYYISGTN